MSKTAALHLAVAGALCTGCRSDDATVEPSFMPSPAVAEFKSDAADPFFTSGLIPHLRIELAENNLEQLRRNPRAYVQATVREGATVWEEVAVHLKGGEGSYRDVKDRPALTLNFDKFVDGQNFHGLDKLHLNNSVQDASYLCEAVCAKLFLDAGVPAGRVSHARVELNGRDLGFYVLKEGFDRSFLRRHFRNANGNLYDGGFQREITEPLQRFSSRNDVKNYDDLKALAAAVQDPDATHRFARTEKLLDLDCFFNFVALEVITWHWDGYALRKSNYRIYHEPTADKIVFLPSGMDQMFFEPNAPLLPKMEGMVARELLHTARGRLRYRQCMTRLLANIVTAEKVTNHLALLQSRIQPALKAISNDAARHQADAAANLRHAILTRLALLDRQLNQADLTPIR